MLQNVPYYVCFLLTLILAAGIALLLRLVWKKLRPKLRRVRSMTAITAAIALFSLVVWLVFSYCITVATAQLCYKSICDENESFAYHASNSARFDIALEYEAKYPGRLQFAFCEALSYGAAGNTADLSLYSQLEPNVLSNGSFDFTYAAVIYDSDGNILGTTEDFFYFESVTEEHWNANLEEEVCDGYIKAPLDLTRFSEEELALLDEFRTTQCRAMRFTGTLDGQILTPTKIEYVLWNEFNDTVYNKTTPVEHTVSADGMEESRHYEYLISDIISTYDVPWYTLFDDGSSSPEEVTLYTTYTRLHRYDDGGSVTYKDTKYENLLDLLLSLGPASSSPEDHYSKYYSASLHSLSQTILFDVEYVYDYTDWESSTATPIPPVHFYLVTAINASPLLVAIKALYKVYIATFVVLALGVLILSFRIRNRLIEPMERVNSAIENSWGELYRPEDYLPGWREPADLIENYSLTQDQLRIRQNEITRLNTALEYAKDAEQSRRQMVSNVAHEFKTPLAVIHSYAEGLKEHINEEKRDKYVDVILNESEHLDDMVLELLDLSRLEAGRVKLALDNVSLTDLTHGVFERLDMAVQAKELKVSFDLPELCTVQADEARIKQVIENFASNAVKYTPVGGTVRVTVAKQEFHTRPAAITFAIENDSPPLSDEALSKVWETFYRTDDSRSGGSTGLGLAIAKNIVELHGGTCGVRNTETGVEFKFTI